MYIIYQYAQHMAQLEYKGCWYRCVTWKAIEEGGEKLKEDKFVQIKTGKRTMDFNELHIQSQQDMPIVPNTDKVTRKQAKIYQK